MTEFNLILKSLLETTMYIGGIIIVLTFSIGLAISIGLAFYEWLQIGRGKS